MQSSWFYCYCNLCAIVLMILWTAFAYCWAKVILPTANIIQNTKSNILHAKNKHKNLVSCFMCLFARVCIPVKFQRHKLFSFGHWDRWKIFYLKTKNLQWNWGRSRTLWIFYLTIYLISFIEWTKCYFKFTKF